MDSLKGEDGDVGAKGDNGLSAYELAKINGYIGTEEEWIISLKGQNGADGQNGQNGLDGTDGLSAYEVATKNGFIGTEQEWIVSLKGKDGLTTSVKVNGTTYNQIDGVIILPNYPEGGGGGGGSATSPIATVEKVDNISTITITDVNGTTSAEVYDGTDGLDGKDFTYDMFTPEQLQALKGADGQNGANGEDGYTPIKGVDYFDGEKGEKGDAGQDGIDGVNPLYMGADVPTSGDVAIWLDTSEEGVLKAKDIPIDGIDGITASNVQTAIAEVFQFANDTLNDMQDSYATTIVGKGGTVSKAGEVYTQEEINAGINSIEGGSLVTNVIPYMTSATSDTVAITTSNERRSNPAWKLFDGNDSTYWIGDNCVGEWWVRIANTENMTFNKIHMVARPDYPKEMPIFFTISGRNADTENWTVLSTQTLSSFGEAEVREIILGHTYTYKQIEFKQTATPTTATNTSGASIMFYYEGEYFDANDINSIEATVTAKGGVITKVNEVATVTEINAGIESIPSSETGYEFPIPVMTSASQDNFVVTQSSNTIFGYEGWKLFDQYKTTMGPNFNGCWATNGTSGWVAIAIPSALPLNMVELYCRPDNYNSQAIKDFKIQGSQDGETWIDLYEGTNEAWENGEYRTYVVGCTVAYSHYRLYVLNNFGSGNIGMQHWGLFQSDYTPLYAPDIQVVSDAIEAKGGEVIKRGSSATALELKTGVESIPYEPPTAYTVPKLTSNNGQGCVVSCSSFYGVGYEPYQVFNPDIDITLTRGFWASGTNPPEWIQIELPMTAAFNSCKIKARGHSFESQSLKSFNVEGSLDGTNWVTLLEVTNEPSWGNLEERQFTFTTYADYKYYKLSQITPQSGSTVSIGKLEFIDPATYEPFYRTDIDSIEATIENQGGIVTKVGTVATVEEINTGIKTLAGGMISFVSELQAIMWPANQIYDTITEISTATKHVELVASAGVATAIEDARASTLDYFADLVRSIYDYEYEKVVVTDTSTSYEAYVDFAMDATCDYVSRIHYTFNSSTNKGKVYLIVRKRSTNTQMRSETLATITMESVDNEMRFIGTFTSGDAFNTVATGRYIDGIQGSLNFKYNNRWYVYQSPWCTSDIALDSNPSSGLTTQILEYEGFIYTTGMTARKLYQITNITNGNSKKILSINATLGVVLT